MLAMLALCLLLQVMTTYDLLIPLSRNLTDTWDMARPCLLYVVGRLFEVSSKGLKYCAYWESRQSPRMVVLVAVHGMTVTCASLGSACLCVAWCCAQCGV
eukprot:jgi/Chrzof1/13283/Cz07g27140.t1